MSDIEPGDIVSIGASPLLYRCWQIKEGVGSFYVVTKNGRKDRRHNGFSGSMNGCVLVRKCEFPTGTKCLKCGLEAVVMVNGRCMKCNPFRACTVPGCLGDFMSKSLPNWMNRFVCNQCGFEVSR